MLNSSAFSFRDFAVRLLKVMIGFKDERWWRMDLCYFQNIFGLSFSEASIFARYILCLALIEFTVSCFIISAFS